MGKVTRSKSRQATQALERDSEPSAPKEIDRSKLRLSEAASRPRLPNNTGLIDPEIFDETLSVDKNNIDRITEYFKILSKEAQSAIMEIIEADLSGRFNRAGSTYSRSIISDKQSIPSEPFPLVAPKQWSNRSSSQSPVDFLKDVYCPWLSKGLTRAHIRELDRPLYQALATWIGRHSAPEGLEAFFAAPRKANDKKLSELGITTPTDAYTCFPDDRNEADRLYQAALRRTQSTRR